MYGPGYVWILPGSTMHATWRDLGEYTCTRNEITIAAEGTFTTENLIQSLDTDPTITGKVGVVLS